MVRDDQTAGSRLGMAAATLSVMDHYGWKHATVLLEESSVTNAYSQYAKSLQRARRTKRARSISILSMPQITEAVLFEVLKAAQSQSRGLLCYIHAQYKCSDLDPVEVHAPGLTVGVDRTAGGRAKAVTCIKLSCMAIAASVCKGFCPCQQFHKARA